MSPSIPGKPVFPALPPFSSRGSNHTTVERRTALRESLVGKPRGKASRESHRYLNPREGKRDTGATASEEIARACPHTRRGLTPPGRLQKYPKFHVSTGEDSSASGTDSTQGLRPRHRRERNPERPPSNSHGDWPFLRPPERVSAVLGLKVEAVQGKQFSRERIEISGGLWEWWHDPGVPLAVPVESASS